MTLPSTIDEVIRELDRITDDTRQSDSFLGVFAYVYRRTTAEIRTAILRREFDDPERMEQLDVRFANLYIRAYRRYRQKEPASLAWDLSFGYGQKRLALLQHLLLGMNAHINLDLGIATADMASEVGLESLRHDFLKVNEILYRITEEMQGRLARVSPLLFLLDWVGGRKDEVIVDFSLVRARDFAWELAEKLVRLPEAEQERRIREADERVTRLGRHLADPPGRLIPWTLRLIARFEERDARKRMEKLGR